MIYGIGVDLVEIDRIRRGLTRFGQRLARRILSDSEYAEFYSRRNPPAFLATRFAAKEAFAKALGTGLKGGVRLRDISVTSDPSGRPILECTGQALELLRQLDIGRSHVSLADEREYALAFVILEKLTSYTFPLLGGTRRGTPSLTLPLGKGEGGGEERGRQGWGCDGVDWASFLVGCAQPTWLPIARSVPRTLARAARQLFHVLGEGLGAEFQSLDHREVGEQLIGKCLDSHAVTDRERGALDDLPALGSQHLRS